jgi:hypothetical protein
MRTSLMLFMILIAATSMAQQNINVDKNDQSALNFFDVVGGAPVMRAKFTRLVEGSPYYSDEWSKGRILIENNTAEFKNVYVRLNLLDVTLEFRDPAGEELTCSSPVRRVKLVDPVKSTEAIFVHSSFLPASKEFKKGEWLQELAVGKISLYKFHKKRLTESRPYNSATYEQHISTVFFYYAMLNDQFVKIKKASDISELAGDKKAQIEEFIKSKNLDGKDEKAMTEVVAFYNSLQ